MMKVRVSYTVTIDEVIEMDDKFHSLTDTGGWNELPGKEQDALVNEFLEAVMDSASVSSYHDIGWAEEYESGESMYEQ